MQDKQKCSFFEKNKIQKKNKKGLAYKEMIKKV